MSDPYNLTRYVAAQEPVFARVCAELTAGRKQTHWMWFVFPQLRGLGSSPMAERYGVGSIEEARAYLAHPLLGKRLRHCTQLLNSVDGRSAEAIFGYPDYLKFRSCMTLFAAAAGEQEDARGPRFAGGAMSGTATAQAADRVFSEALGRYFAGEGDPLTREALGR
ncbi:MAG TPA: DUF1810 domain-containing protein [Steroidobacteraceae bacterium]|nr:DUF1810 domain-containing protein [Steroidobacteraceae bacterium]